MSMSSSAKHNPYLVIRYFTSLPSSSLYSSMPLISNLLKNLSSFSGIKGVVSYFWYQSPPYWDYLHQPLLILDGIPVIFQFLTLEFMTICMVSSALS